MIAQSETYDSRQKQLNFSSVQDPYTYAASNGSKLESFLMARPKKVRSKRQHMTQSI